MSRSDDEKEFRRVTKDVMKEFRVWQKGRLDWYWYLGLTGTVLGIGGSIAGFFTSYGITITTVTITIIFVLSLIALAISACLYVSARKKSADAKAYEFIHLSIHQLRDSFSRLNRDSFTREEDYVFFLQMTARTVLTCLAQGFGVLTGSRCRACIKVLDVPGDSQTTKENVVARGQVKTFCRDEISATILDQVGQKDAPIKLAGNGRYRTMLMNPDVNKFHCPDVKAALSSGQYENSRYDQKKSPCYNSILIVPIRVKHNASEPLSGYNGQDGAQTNEQTLIGYLVVDSEASGVLGESRDHHAVAIVADALFIFLNLAFDRIPTSNGLIKVAPKKIPDTPNNN